MRPTKEDTERAHRCLKCKAEVHFDAMCIHFFLSYPIDM